MERPAIPDDEQDRLLALRRYGVLDTPPEARFDRLTSLVADQLGVPIALVSLVDGDRQWFKSCVGLDARETPREVSFCGHAILGERTFVVEDATRDRRFHDNPLVQGPPDIRFYAGAPLILSSGHRVGTLCAIDRAPRCLSDGEERLLRDLSAVVVDELEMNAMSQALVLHAEILDDRNDELEDFARALSHDLAMPVRRMRMLTDWLEAGDVMAPEQVYAHMRATTKVAARLLDGLKSYLAAGVSSPDATCTARAAVDGALEVFDDQLRELGVEVEVAALPDAALPEGPLRVVFQNLLANAIKYRAERPLTIAVGAADRGGEWEFTVADNGIGIGDAHHERVFDLLFRLHTEDQIAGSGIGLSTCRRMLAAIGGRIWLTSRPGRGTTVRFAVPKAPLRVPAAR